MKVKDLRLLLSNFDDEVEVYRSDSEWGPRKILKVGLEYKDEYCSWSWETKEEVVDSHYGYCRGDTTQEELDEFVNAIQTICLLG